MNKKLISGGAIVVLLVLFLSVNVLSSTVLKSARIDLTANKLYTLSEGTENILEALEDPIRLRFFYSKGLGEEVPDLNDYANRVQELLEEYVSIAGDDLTLEVLDPEPYSEAEELAGSFGLRGVPVNQAGEMLYFGLVGTNSTDDEARIPFFDQRREEFLEYDLTQLVYKLSDPAKPVVGLISSLPMFGAQPNPMDPMAQPEQPWFIVEQMQQLFDVRELQPPLEAIEEDVDVVVVVHPKQLGTETLYALDQFVLGGGKILAFVDPWAEVEPSQAPPNDLQQRMNEDHSSNLDPLLEAWGVELVPGKIAADRLQAQRVSYKNQPTDYLAWIGVREDGLDQDDLTTADLGQVNMGTVGILETLESATTTVVPIIRTSEEAMKVDRSRVSFMPDPEGLLKDFYSEGASLALAVRVTGSAKSAFPGGPPKDAEEDAAETETDDAESTADGAEPDGAEDGAEPETHLAESQGPINVIVVADADILDERHWVQFQNFFGMRVARPLADNGDFIINAIDNLSGSNDLISLRSRGRFNRPFDKKDELRREADERFREKYDELNARLNDVRTRINELQGERSDQGSILLTPEQLEEIEKAKEERRVTQRELREVRHQLRKDIEGLGRKLKFVNILGVPLLVCAAAVAAWAFRSNRRS